MKSDNNYLVTVIVPSYNHKRFIMETLNSIKAQTFQNFQWIVVDDGSRDGTQELLKEKQEEYGYELILQKNKGVSRTLTDTISNFAKGKYICYCASDDAWMPNKLELQVAYMEEHPEYAMCYGKTYDIDQTSQIIQVSDSSKYEEGHVFESIITLKFHPPVNYMYRKSVLKEVGYFPTGVIAEDFYMNCKLSYKYQIGYIPEILGYYRLDPKQHRDPWSLYRSHIETIELYRNEPIYKEAISLAYLRAFNILAMFNRHKVRALKFMCLSYRHFFTRMFFVGIYHWLFRWIKLNHL